jgi:plastocyanin
MTTRRRPTWLAVPLVAMALAVTACAGEAATPSPSPAAPDPTPAVTASPAPADTPEPTAEATDATEPEAVRVRITSSRFDPGELTVAVGTQVTFLNADSFAHTVTEGTGGQAADGAIVDEEIAQNGTVRVTFDEPGTYEITCRFHPSMQMTITVEG